MNNRADRTNRLPFGDRQEFLSVISELFSEAGKGSIVLVSGISMKPILLDGESLLINHEQKDLRIGDIGVFNRNGMLMVHRVLFRKRSNDGLIYRTKGDWMLYVDPSLKSDCVVGKVSAFTRKNRSYRLDMMGSRIYAIIMVLYSFSIAIDGKAGNLLDQFVNLLRGLSKGEEKKEIRFFRNMINRTDRFLQLIFHGIFFRLFHRASNQDLRTFIGTT
ncbi:MAG: S24/S26 family peptidase [Acidobacteriota bacterium]